MKKTRPIDDLIMGVSFLLYLTFIPQFFWYGGETAGYAFAGIGYIGFAIWFMRSRR